MSLRSNWEAFFYLCNPHLDYETIRIPYMYKNINHNYIVDFVDETKRIIYEIKPDSEKQDEKVLAKEKYAKEWCIKNNYTFLYISNDWFNKNYKPTIIIESELVTDFYKDKMIKALKQFL